ncbi:MAG: cytochrome bd-I oxidase subunit CydX [Methylovirgula sp.]
MWYFSWILGVGFAGAFSILNAMWLELSETAPPESDERAPRVTDRDRK